MNIQEALSPQSDSEKINNLKNQRGAPQPAVDKLKKELDPKCHPVVTDKVKRPDKSVVVSVPQPDGTTKDQPKTEYVNRQPLALQQIIVERAAAFTFGNPVTLKEDTEGEQEAQVKKAVTRILEDNKMDSVNMEIAEEIYSMTEAAEYWYPVPVEGGYAGYGFQSQFKMKMQVFSPQRGDTLYPFFDETGDMTAFSREYRIKDASNNEIVYFETWTNKKYYRWKQTDSAGGWVLDKNVDIAVGKIPVIYGRQPQAEWERVEPQIERLETLASNFADTNDYHGAPKIIVNGQIMGWSKKGESGAIIEMEKDATAKYLSWEQAPDSVKTEVDFLLKMIYGLTQTPDISFDSVKGLGSAASGKALQLLFLDAHLKVKKKMRIFDAYLQRRVNLLKAFVAQLNTSWKTAAETLNIKPIVTPYMIDDISAMIANIVDAKSGGILSQETGVALNPLVQDPETEMEKIGAEREAAAADPAGLDEQQDE